MGTLLKTKRVAWAITFTLVTVIALLSFFSGQRYLAAARAVEHAMAVQSTIEATLTSVVEAESSQRGYLLTEDARFLEPLEGARRDAAESLHTLEELTRGDPEHDGRRTEVRRLVSAKFAFIEASNALQREGRGAEATSMVRSRRGKDLMDQLRVHCSAMSAHEAGLLAQRKAAAVNAERLAVVGIAVGTLATALIALLSLFTVHRDVNELKRAGQELAKSEEHYRLLSTRCSDLVRLLEPNGKVTYVSPSVTELLGYSVAEFTELAPMALMHPSEVQLANDHLAEALDGKTEGGVTTYRLRHKDGEYRWFEVHWGAIRDEAGALRELHTAGRDVTERRAAEEERAGHAKRLRALSMRDDLTGLYNRRGFIEVAGQMHRQTLDEGRSAALIFVDLNGMKRINDEFGHDVGDEALVDTAHVLSSALEGSDVVARLGGDEFVAFALDVGPPRLELLRARLRELASARVAERARRFRLSMSVGAAFVDPGAQTVTPTSLEALLEQADTAMYQQKRARQAAGGVSIPPPDTAES